IARIVVWFFLQQARAGERWMEEGPIDAIHDGGTLSLPTARLGPRVFLAVDTVLFMLLIMAYGIRMALEEWRTAPQLSRLWLNTAMLVLSSVPMQWAQSASRRGEIDGVRIGLIVGGVFAVAFLGGQILAWRQLN